MCSTRLHMSSDAREPRVHDMTDKAHDVATIEAFVVESRRKRCLTLVASERGRAKLRHMLAHFQHLDPRYAQLLSPTDQERIGDILRREGAPATCYVLSEDTELDGRVMDLDVALGEIVGRGMGTFISCIPGRLAYFEGEEPGERYLLMRVA